MPKRADANQPLAVAALRALGFLVQPIHECGGGIPDLIVSGRRGNVVHPMLLVELKCNLWTVPPHDPRWTNTLTPDEQKWHADWRYANIMITNRARWILTWFGWGDDEIREALTALPAHPLVRRALAETRRKYGEISPEIMATIEFE